MENKVIQGDCLNKLKELPDNSIDAIVTDPPYELGFMGKSWDSTGIANNVELWKECLRVLKHGGHLLAFSGTRTYHRMASAIEDAGFEVRDMIEWVYGSGFPKSLNIGKAVDKLQGNERKEYLAPIAKPDSDCWGIPNNNSTGEVKNPSSYNVKTENISVPGGMRRHTKGTSEWEGWGTALKPAHEPICMARKPLAEKTVAENVLKYGTGGINIDGSRVEGTYENEGRNIRQEDYQSEAEFLTALSKEGRKTRSDSNPQGRFPANLIHDNSEEVRECFPEQKSSGNRVNVQYKNPNNPVVNFGGGIKNDFNDSGNASRFFKSIIYQAKASKSERNRGCEGLEEKVSGHRSNFRCQLCGYQKASGTPCKCENPVWDEIPLKPQSNNHPTVKPIALMEYLVNLVSKEGHTILDPFAGSGTTGIACKKLNRNFIGIERDEEYCKIAEARINNLTLN